MSARSLDVACKQLALLALLVLVPAAQAAVENGVRIKDLGRIGGVRDNMVAGYGIVIGLAGTGDSSRSAATLQSVANALREFGVNVNATQINSRNVAAVMVSATLPALARSGDKIDVNVASLGDARSLVGGTLLMTPVYGPDRRIYALAQGALSVGGYSYDMNGNVVQKNHPTAAMIPEGALIEADVSSHIVSEDGHINLVLFNPDYTTANRVAQGVNGEMGREVARPVDAGRVEIAVPEPERGRIVEFVARLERVLVEPDQRGRVIVSERTGTVVAGGDVRLSKVAVTHGELRVAIVTDYIVSQPSGFLVEPGSGVRTETVPRTRIDVKEPAANSVSLQNGATVNELVGALNQIKTSTRDMIAILQAIKRAGALHAELIIQ